MLTPELLTQRLKTWSSQVPTAIAPASPSSIALCQHLFALMHDLKTSVNLSESPAIRKLEPRVLSCDAVLRPLAYDELELIPDDSTKLYELARNLESLMTLESFLTQVKSAAQTPNVVRPALLEQAFPWEGLSRARARSAFRHGYRFFQRDDATTLRELPALEQLIQKQIREWGGILVVRKLDAGAPQGTDLTLSTKLVAALPPGNAAAPAPWQPL